MATRTKASVLQVHQGIVKTFQKLYPQYIFIATKEGIEIYNPNVDHSIYSANDLYEFMNKEGKITKAICVLQTQSVDEVIFWLQY